MHTVNKKILIGVLIVALTAVCAISGVLLSGHIPSRPAENTTQPTTERAIEPLPVGKKADVPSAVRGTKYFLSQTSGTQMMQKIAQSGFNCVFLKPSKSDAAFSATDVPSALSDAVAEARKAGLYTAVDVRTDTPDAVADFARKSGADCIVLSGVFEQCSTQSLDKLRETIRSFEASALPTQISALLWEFPFDAHLSAQNAGFLTAFSKAIQDASFTGVYVQTDDSDDAFASGADAWLTYAADKPIWFALTDSVNVQKAGFLHTEKAFAQTSALLKLETQQHPVSFIFTEFSAFADDAECAKIVFNCMTQGFLPDSYLKTFKVTNHNGTTITTTESKITFLGESNPAYALTCGGKSVPVTDDGFFSVEYDLNVGKNRFDFVCDGKTYTYTVQYNLDLIRSISPSGSLQTPGGSALEISVVAHRKASVYATLNGAKITLVGSNALLSDAESGHMDTSSDYVTFTGKYNLPESTSKSMSLGPIKAFASYQSTSDSITGANVTVTAAEKIEALPVVEPPKTTATSATVSTTESTTASTTSATETAAADTTDDETDLSETSSGGSSSTSTTKVPISTATTTTTTTTTSSSSSTVKLDPPLTPYKYNGIAGTKRMCKITTYYAETMPLSPLNDLSVPLTTPLLTGTFDFITGESSFDTYTYYNLGSGRRVYRKDVEVIEKGYALPANVLTLVNSGTSSGKTNINLHLKWKVPFNAVLNGQKYINDPRNRREYAVTSLNAKSLDITFYYTAEAIGQPNVSASGVISGCEWVQSSSAQTCTLRLYLRSASRFYGYSVSYNADDTLHISIKEKGSDSISGKTVMLDPGHGGTDGGAPCAVNGSTYNEAKIALTISEKVKAKLQAMGASVIMTRTSNSDLTLVSRKRMARTNNPDVFVSIHMDSAASSSGYGTTAFYYRPYSYALAKSIHTQLVNTYVQSIYGTQKSTIDRGTVFYPYSVTRIEECPSVLIECGYVSNLEECKILQNSKHQDSIATAIANGIRDFFASN